MSIVDLKKLRLIDHSKKIKNVQFKHNLLLLKFKKKIWNFIEKKESNYIFLHQVYYKGQKKKLNLKIFNRLINAFKKEVLIKVNDSLVQNYKTKQIFIKKYKNSIYKNIYNFKFFLGSHLTGLKLYTNLLKIYLLILTKKKYIINYNIIYKKKKVNKFLQKLNEKLKLLKKTKKLKLFFKNKKKYMIKKLNEYFISNLFNLFIIKFNVTKNNIFATCYSLYYAKKRKKYLKKRLYMLSAGRIGGFKGSNKKTRPAIEKFSSKFFTKLKNYQYNKNKKPMKNYNLIFEYENIYCRNLISPFFDSILWQYYKIRLSILNYIIPHNKGLKKKKKRRV